MKELFEGIQTQFNSNSDLASAFPNGLESSVGADAEAFPTCILQAVSSSVDGDTNPDTWIEGTNFDFVIRQDIATANAASFLFTAGEKLDSLFHKKIFDLTSDRMLWSERKGLRGPYREDDRSLRYDLTYKFDVQKYTSA